MNEYITFVVAKKGNKNVGDYQITLSSEDVDLSHQKWFITQAGYVLRSAGKRQSIHRMIMERILGRPLVKGELVDHINHDTFDNRRENLRLATNGQNQHNARKNKNNTSGYKGVDWSKHDKKWRARIMVNEKRIQIGLFNNKEDAKKARDEAAIKYHGEFAKLD